MIFKILLCFFIIICSVPAYGGQVLKVGIGNVPPWIFPEGSVTPGADKELLIAILDKLNIKYEFEYMPFVKVLEKLKSGNIDMAIGLFYREDRDKYIQYVSPPLRTKSLKSFYVLRSDHIRIQKYTDLLGKKIGVGYGIKYFPVFDVDHRVEKIYSYTLEDSFNQLLMGNVDVVISDQEFADYYIKDHNLDSRIVKCVFKYNPRSVPVYLVFSRNSQFKNRIEEIGAVLKSLQENGEQDRIMRKYLGNRSELFIK